MGSIRAPEPVKLFAGLITNDTGLIEKAKKALARKFGPADFESDLFDFGFTTYYDDELGKGLKRKFITFKKLVIPESMQQVKRFTNKIESGLGLGGRRRINIDPGYISLGKLVLLTTKDHYHRIYIGGGIYGEVTLYYKDKAFWPLPWSYPDYKEHSGLFNEIRENYRQQLRQKKC